MPNRLDGEEGSMGQCKSLRREHVNTIKNTFLPAFAFQVHEV